MKPLGTCVLVAAILSFACGSSGGGTGSSDAGAGSGGTSSGGSPSGGASSGGSSSGGSSGSCNPPPSTSPVTCGTETCGVGQICVLPCCGGAPRLDGEACKPAPPYCVEATAITCSDCGDYDSCSETGCSGMMDGAFLDCLCA